MLVFFDSSAFAKRYVQENGTEEVLALCDRAKKIGLAGIAAAITDAVHHATGVRVGELPVTIEDLLV